MLDSYRMVVVSGIASSITAAGLIVYRYIYPKKKPNLLYLLIIISLLPLISILRKGSYESGDLSLHVKFAMQFFDNLKEGNIIPIWIAQHCSGYGCPAYLFLFSLPYYIISLFHFLGLPFLTGAKLLLMLSFITSGIGMFVWMRNELGEKAGFVTAIFYLFAPYHLIDLHFRVSVGELLSMAILPYLFFSTKRLTETHRQLYFFTNTVLFTSLILSHQVTAFVSFPLLLLYTLFTWMRTKKRNVYTLLIASLSFFSGILLSAFYWIPILSEGKFTMYGNENDISFHPLSSFLYSSNRFGLLFQGHRGELYFNIGYVQWVIIAVSIYFLVNGKIKGKEKTLLWGCMILFAIFFFMMQSISKPIWEIIPVIKDFEFSWRLLIEIIIFVSIMAGIVLKKINSDRIIIIVCAISILYTMLNWGNRKTISSINDAALRKQPVFTEFPGGVDFTTPKWVDKYKPWIGKIPSTRLETLSGNATIVEVSRQIVKHEYVLLANTDLLLKENTYYYPGWKVLLNEKETPIIFTNKQYPGVMTFHVKKGLYRVDVLFTDTIDRIIGKWISGITFLFLLLYCIILIPRTHLRRMFP